MKHRIFTFYLAIVAAYAVIVAPAAAEVEKREFPGIENFSQIEGAAGFAGAMAGFGGATQPSAMSGLKSAGFTTVINLRLSSEEGADVDGSRASAEAAGLNYIHLPFDASKPDLSIVDKFLSAVGTEKNQPAYMHCHSATRAAALWMIGRVLKDNWDIEAAGEEVEMISPKPAEAIAFATRYIESQEK